MREKTNDDAIRAWSTAGHRAGEFGEEGDFARQFLLNPAIFDLLGDVNGKWVLDAGCGQGYLSRLLARKGARVTGVEPADGWYTYAHEREQREQLGIRYIKEDLCLLTDVEGGFDVVVANMVLMDLADLVSATRNCIAALKPGGLFVFSLLHPCFEDPGSEWAKKRFVEVHEYLSDYVREQTFAPLFHRPLSTYLNLVVDSGATIRRVIEPRLSPELAKLIENDRDVHVPSFLVIAASKEGR